MKRYAWICMMVWLAFTNSVMAVAAPENEPTVHRTIAVIGTGEVGSALGRRWVEAGHTVVFGSRTPESQRVRELVAEIGDGAAALGVAEAAASAEIIVLAVPFCVVERIAAKIGDLHGKIVIDCTNPISRDFHSLTVGHTTSAAEIIADLLPGARVVKALNVTGANNMADSTYPDGPLLIPIAGESVSAKRIVSGLVEDLGFEAVDVGPLSSARLLEPLALLWIRMAAAQNDSMDLGFKIIRR